VKRSIEQLLRDVDDTTSGGLPAAQAGLAERVRSVARRRRVVRRVAGATLVCAVAVTIVAAVLTSRPTNDSRVVAINSAPPAPADARAELAALRAEADREAARAARMIAIERAAAARVALRRHAVATPDASEQARQQLERAALSMVYQADRLAERNAPAAERVYAAAAANFPGTHWASVARERLAVDRERKDGSG
jgi:hypothetical protein